MKIVVIYLGRLGAGTVYSLEMTKALSIENQIQILLSENIENKDFWITEFKENKNINIDFFPTYTNFSSFIFNSFNFVNFYNIIKTIKKFKPDAVYAPFMHLWSSILYCFLRKYKVYSTVHDVKIHLGENLFLYPPYIASIKLSNKLIILNNKDIDNAMKMGFKKDDICVIPHASFSYYKKVNIKKDNALKNNVLFIGRIEKYKGIQLLLESFEKVLVKLPNLKLTIAGNGNLKPYENNILKMGKSLLINNKWLSDSEIGELVDNCDFLVLPYIDASQSGIIPLAFGCGKTVIVTNVGALSEQVPDNLGIIVNPNIDEISSAINFFYDNPEKINEFSTNALKYSSEELSWNKSAETLINFIKRHIN